MKEYVGIHVSKTVTVAFIADLLLEAIFDFNTKLEINLRYLISKHFGF